VPNPSLANRILAVAKIFCVEFESPLKGLNVRYDIATYNRFL
jgi:hypothetical protein